MLTRTEKEGQVATLKDKLSRATSIYVADYRGIDVDVEFESLSGDIHSDFDITMTGRRSRRWIGAEVEGYIGSRGERSLSFNTISGDVRLRRAR